MLHVIRTFEPIELKKDRLYQPAQLSESESAKFIHFFAREVPERKGELEKAINSREPNAKTPFYLGLLTFEKDFVGIDRYISDRLQTLTELQSRIVAYFAFAHYYGQQSISSAAFSTLLGTPRKKSVNMSKHLGAALDLLVESEFGKWRTSHPIVAESCIKHILRRGMGDPETWKYQLSAWGKDFASFCRGDAHLSPVISEESLNIVRRVFVYRDNAEMVGTEAASRKIFSPLIDNLPSKEAKLEVYRHLTDVFPEEAHFWAHLARLLYIEFAAYGEAEQNINRALELNPKDHVIHHMKGMILRGKVYDLIRQELPLKQIVEVSEIASQSFSEARELSPDDEHGYISEVQLIIKVFQYANKLSGLKPLEIVTAPESQQWLREALQLAESLLAQARQIRIREKLSEYEQSCRAKLDEVYGEFDKALQIWDRLLTRTDIYAPPIRRQLVWTYLARRDHKWEGLQPKEIKRIRELLDTNLHEETGSETNLRLWLRAIRLDSSPPSMETIIEQVSYWRSISNSLDSSYYLYVLYALQVLSGFIIDLLRINEYLEECRNLSRSRRRRNWSFEWLGKGMGISQLIHQDQLIEWSEEKDFWSDTRLLRRIEGVIKRIHGPQAGEIELPGGITSFFVPGKSNHLKGRDENKRIACFLGFSYDGPRSWSVIDAIPTRT
jgi:tetratricopeptide (TPR) repeat protein